VTLQFCVDELRRIDVEKHAVLNGIDAIEVLGENQPAGVGAQRTLLVRCFKPIAALTRANVSISSAARAKPVTVAWAARANAIGANAPGEQTWYANNLTDLDKILVVRTDAPGDFSRYTLRIIDGGNANLPAATFDPRLSAHGFSFKVDCPSEFDCAATADCAIEPATAPDIDYLSKDYAGYRRLILDRLSHLVPDWQDRSPADLGVVLAELLAYAGDLLSYEQDAVATESYLGTARRRVSVRRHCTLVDYHLHDGCNARAWAIVDVTQPRVDLQRKDIRFVTRLPGLSDRRVAPDATAVIDAIAGGLVEVFEPMQDMTLFSDHHTLPFYTWGDRNCCLPRGATTATLAGHFPNLRADDVLIVEELIGPQTHDQADADLAHRQAVRLRSVRATVNGARLTDPLYGAEITEIEWHPEDALRFPVRVSSEREADGQYSDRVSVARGNVVLLDHGRSMADTELEDLGAVPVPARRYRPRLARTPLTQAAPLGDRSGPARDALVSSMNAVVPAIRLRSTPGDVTWTCRRDLLSSKAADAHFVVETEDDGSAAIRFGDNENGNRPESGSRFGAWYRVGNGVAGNVGAEAIAHALTTNGAVAGVRNPIAAAGGTEPQSIEDARRRAPHAFRRQERAVTPDDYARRTEEHDGIQRASARMRWTGSWHTMFVAVDREDGLPLSDPLERELAGHVDRFRMAGHDLEFDQARLVPLEIEIRYCRAPGFRYSDVKAALIAAVAALFDPDRLTFGQTVYLSPIYSAAHAVAGVQSAEITIFQRQGLPGRAHLDSGEMTFGALEIAQLDNDPNFPDRGVLRVIDKNP
jgi:hypothetical protein